MSKPSFVLGNKDRPSWLKMQAISSLVEYLADRLEQYAARVLIVVV